MMEEHGQNGVALVIVAPPRKNSRWRHHKAVLTSFSSILFYFIYIFSCLDERNVFDVHPVYLKYIIYAVN